MATHSSTLAWKIPWTEEHGRLQLFSYTVIQLYRYSYYIILIMGGGESALGGSYGKESACNAGKQGSIWVRKIPWIRERLCTPVFWPGEFHGLCSPGVAKNQTRLSDFHFHFTLITYLPQWTEHPEFMIRLW